MNSRKFYFGNCIANGRIEKKTEKSSKDLKKNEKAVFGIPF